MQNTYESWNTEPVNYGYFTNVLAPSVYYFDTR